MDLRNILNNLRRFSNLTPRGGFSLGAKVALGAVALSVIGYESVYTVDGGHRAVIFNKVTGIKEKVYGEGTKFKIPFIEVPIIYNVRSTPRNISSPTGSKDLQTVNITLRVLSKPDTEKLAIIYRTLGTDYDERILPSIINEVLKSVVAQFNASQLITQRERVSALIRDRLVERARDFHILLDDVSITHLSFSREYASAVESKQVAQQDAERAKFVVEKAEQDKKSAIIKAQGEATSARVISGAMQQNPNFINLRRIEAARENAKVLVRSGNRVILDSDNLLFNLMGDTKEEVHQEQRRQREDRNFEVDRQAEIERQKMEQERLKREKERENRRKQKEEQERIEKERQAEIERQKKEQENENRRIQKERLEQERSQRMLEERRREEEAVRKQQEEKEGNLKKQPKPFESDK